MIGSEGTQHTFSSPDGNNHKFLGGNIMASYFLTNTSRPYRTDGSIFGFVKVRKSVFKGGPGEFEAVLNVSTFNVNDGDIHGGQITRVTPMINWYMSKVVRTEFIYGYVFYNRYDLKGRAQLFEARIQFTLM
jgi:phosphate-selective porin OprO/OprP